MRELSHRSHRGGGVRLRGRILSALPLGTAVILAAACSGYRPPPAGQEPPAPVAEPPEAVEKPVEAAAPDTLMALPEPTPEAPPPVPEPPPTWAEQTLQELDLREKVGQMIMPWVLGDFSPEGSASHDRVAELVREWKVGGLIMSVGSPMDVAVKLNDLQAHADVPLLVAADLETGAGFRFSGTLNSPTNIVLGGATNFPSLMAVGATGSPALAYDMGRITGQEARALGVHVPFAPVLDVNNNPDNPIINTRSFGEHPRDVAILGTSFVRGVQEAGAIATGKHFPGHGDTDVDSHLGLPLIRADRARLDTLELRPFQAAIDAGMGGVMTAHITVPSLNGGNGDPATLSSAILSDLLRDRMGFHGLLFTDAMDMGAIDRTWGRREATIRAVEAGADVILMPPSVGEAVQGLVQAVESGRISEERVDSSVLRILRAKESLGLAEDRLVDISEVPRIVGIPDHVEKAEEIARRSITLLRNQDGILPLSGVRSARVLSVSYRRSNDLLAGRTFDARLRSTYPRFTTETVGRDTPASIYSGLLAQAGRSQLVIISLYVTAVSYSGNVATSREMAGFIQDLASRRIPHVIISFGNPYLLREFPDARTYMLAWSGSDVSQRAAADALLGRFEITGRTPTRLPPFFEIGDGIRLPARGGGG